MNGLALVSGSGVFGWDLQLNFSVKKTGESGDGTVGYAERLAVRREPCEIHTRESTRE
jgi:hypothetical protein